MPLRRRLKKNAIPTLNLSAEYENKSVPNQTPCSKKVEKRSYKHLVNSVLTESTIKTTEETTEDMTEKLINTNTSVSPSLNVSNTSIDTSFLTFKQDKVLPVQSSISSLNIEADYKQKYEDLLMEFKQFKRDSMAKVNRLNKMLKYYRTKLYSHSLMKYDKLEMSDKLLNTVLTKNQISLLSKKKKRVCWTYEEIATAFTLRYYSKKCYLYLRSMLNYPLPALSSLRRWACRLDLAQGILKDVLLMMRLAGEDFTSLEKVVVLQFDEVKVRSVQEYDVAKDQVLGPYSQLQVVQARELFSKWKQPVYLAFDQKVTKQLLYNIISELHNISYSVVACVSDCGGGNIGLWKQLNVDMENPFFKHPKTDSNIYIYICLLTLHIY